MATPPRISPPGTIFKLTQRVTTGQFWLRPDPIINQTFLYLLALHAERAKIEVHLATVLSNHFHILLTDVLGDRIQAFNRDFLSILAKAINKARDRHGNLLDPDGVNCVDICDTAEDLVDHGAYVSMNAVEAGLIDRARKWPGVNLLPSQMGRDVMVIDRPSQFSRRMPARVQLTLTIPKASDCSRDELRDLMCAEHRSRERSKRQRMAEQGKTFMGRKRVLRQSLRSAPFRDPPRRKLVPQIACKNKELRKRMLVWREERRLRYREQLKKVQAGIDDVIFPLGTWFQHVLCGRRRDPWDGSIWAALMAES